MQKLIEKTQAFCPECMKWHEAEVVSREGRIFGEVHCPDGLKDHLVSSDADSYVALRQKSPVHTLQPAGENLSFTLNYLSITNDCNFYCSVCATDAGRKSNPVFLSLEEIKRRAKIAKQMPSRILHLFGGEPTVHPQLLEIIELLNKMGFLVGLVTNGYLLGQDPDLAGKLKKSGLHRVCLQFDSNSIETLKLLRRNKLPEKRSALKNALDAGLKTGLNCTVTRFNLPEVSLLLENGLKGSHLIQNMTFGTAAPTGRFQIDPLDSVDREQVIAALLNGDSNLPLTFDDFLPLPAYRPWGLETHPDCGAHVIFIRTSKTAFPLNHLVDMEKAYNSLASSRYKKPSWLNTRIIPALHFLREIRPGKRWAILRILMGFLLNPSGHSVVNVAVSNYRSMAFLDKQRLDRCASAFHTSVGPVPACYHFFTDERFKGSRLYESRHNSC